MPCCGNRNGNPDKGQRGGTEQGNGRETLTRQGIRGLFRGDQFPHRAPFTGPFLCPLLRSFLL